MVGADDGSIIATIMTHHMAKASMNRPAVHGDAMDMPDIELSATGERTNEAVGFIPVPAPVISHAQASATRTA